jgi:hypothetical protein
MSSCSTLEDNLLASVLIATTVVLCIVGLWCQSGAAVALAVLLVALAEPLGFADTHEEEDADLGGVTSPIDGRIVIGNNAGETQALPRRRQATRDRDS